jgi:cysteine synthase
LVFVNKVVDGSSSNNFTKMILNALLKGRVLTMEDMSKKHLCFKIEEMNVFQSIKKKIAKQIKNS